MINSPYIIFYISGIVLLLMCVMLFWYSLPKLVRKRKNRDVLPYSDYLTACAGTPKGDEPKKAKAVALDVTVFKTQDGTEINPDDYLVFLVKGNSMKFANIHDGDLIFVAKGFRIVNLKKFPYILVLKRNNPKPGESEYKIRRAWKIAQYNPNDRFEKEIREIMASKEFCHVKKLKNDDGQNVYLGDEAVIEDFLTERLKEYEDTYIKCKNPDLWNKTVVISTTFDTKKKQKFIHFSIHPIGNIVGIVKDSFTLPKQNSCSTDNYTIHKMTED